MERRSLIYFAGVGGAILLGCATLFFIWRGYILPGDPVFNDALAKANGDVVEALKDCGRCELNDQGEIESLFLEKVIERGSRGRPKPPLKHNNHVMKYVKEVSSIKHLGISPLTEINRNAMDEVSEMSQLVSLQLNGIDIDDEALAKLDSLKNLRSISLFVTKVTEAGVRKFIEAHPDCEVRWGNLTDPNNPALPTIRAVQESQRREEERKRLRKQPLRK